MAFVAGPRQVGKTTTCRACLPDASYLNADVDEHRRLLLSGQESVAERIGFGKGLRDRPGVVFDEVHKLARWKQFLKGFYDLYSSSGPILVTGSSRLDVYRRGGDSLMGRYFLFHMHPLSVGELARPDERDVDVLPPKRIAAEDWDALFAFGGFPEPFVRRDERFSRRWRDGRAHQLVSEDLRDLTRFQDLATLEKLARILSDRSATQLNYSGLAVDLLASVDSVRRWIDAFTSLHHGFLVRPWSKSVTRALAKQPKWYASDWSGLADPGQRAETIVACHLQKSVQGWTDLGLGCYELYYVRDKQKHEVDFLVVRERKPWLLVEVKSSEERLSADLARFQAQLGAPHALQCVLDLPYEDVDVFEFREPTVVSAQTLLSQLL
ncbi:MAG: ATP-binding protein [Planctomycetes bacterium]|nr:ATP-binding protein [Planctomycetota bacterium]